MAILGGDAVGDFIADTVKNATVKASLVAWQKSKSCMTCEFCWAVVPERRHGCDACYTVDYCSQECRNADRVAGHALECNAVISETRWTDVTDDVVIARHRKRFGD